jgi:hypothetical protein
MMHALMVSSLPEVVSIVSGVEISNVLAECGAEDGCDDLAPTERVFKVNSP